MPVAYERKYPIDKSRPFVDFSGGLNTDSSSYTMKDNEWRDGSWNVRANPMGPVSGRYGTTRKTPAAGLDPGSFGEPAKAIAGLYRYYKRDGNHLYLVVLENTDAPAETEVYSFDDLDAISLSLVARSAVGAAPALPHDARWRFVTVNDWVYMVAEGADVWRTDGSNLYLVGEQCDEVATSFTYAVGNVAVGTYYYIYTWVWADNLGESPASAVDGPAVVSGSPQHIRLNGLTTVLPRDDITAMRIYRTTVNGSTDGPFWYVGEHAYGGASTYTDDLTDAELGAAFDTTIAKPPDSATIELHHDRLFLGNTENRSDEVAVSNPSRPDEFPADLLYRFDTGQGEEVRGLKSNGGILYVATLNNLWGLIGTGAARGPGGIPDYRRDKLAGGFGSPGTFSQEVMQVLRGALYMTNRSNVWRITGGEVLPLSELRVQRFIQENIDDEYAHLSVGVSTDNDYRVSFPSTVGPGLPDYTLIYDVRSDAFMPDKGYYPGRYSYLGGKGDTGLLLIAEARALQQIYVADDDDVLTTTIADWDTSTVAYLPIERVLITKDWIIPDLVEETFQGRLLVIDAPKVQSTVAVRTVVRLDGHQNLEIAPIDLIGNPGVWGVGQWGDGRKWGEFAVSGKRLSLPTTCKGRRLGFKFIDHTDQYPFEIEHLTLVGELRGIRGVE